MKKASSLCRLHLFKFHAGFIPTRFTGKRRLHYRLQHRCHHIHILAKTCAAPHFIAGFYGMGLLQMFFAIMCNVNIMYTSRTPSLTRNSLDCDVFVATTKISLRKQRKCASSLIHAVISIQLSTTPHTAHSQSIHNRHRIVTQHTRGKNPTHSHISPT